MDAKFWFISWLGSRRQCRLQTTRTWEKVVESVYEHDNRMAEKRTFSFAASSRRKAYHPKTELSLRGKEIPRDSGTRQLLHRNFALSKQAFPVVFPAQRSLSTDFHDDPFTIRERSRDHLQDRECVSRHGILR